MTRDFRLAFSLGLVCGGLIVRMSGLAAAAEPGASRLVLAEVASDLVPGPVEYAVLLPPGYRVQEDQYPLVLFLHGGGGDRRFLERTQRLFDDAWNTGELPPLVAATPSAGRSLYTDFKDGSQRWQQFLSGPFLEHLRSSYHVSAQRRHTAVCGVSMGGLGALLLGFNYPDRFAGLAAIEPGIMPALDFKDVPPINQTFRDRQLLERLHGQPVDEAHWRRHNPAAIAVDRADQLRDSGLAIYVECGNQDRLRLYDGAEFLHQQLVRVQIPHEYHLVDGADHLGPTVPPRIAEALRYVGRVLAGGSRAASAGATANKAAAGRQSE